VQPPHAATGPRRVVVDLLSYTGRKGGMETYTRELYRAMGELVPDVEFVGFASRELARALDSTWFPGRIVDSGVSGEDRWSWARAELFAVSRFARDNAADIVHCPATLGPRRSPTPIVYTMHDMNYFTMPELMRVKAYNKPVQWMERQASRTASRIITDSTASAEDIVEYLRFPRESIDVVQLAGTPTTARVTRSPDPSRPLFLGMGSRIWHKNWPLLIEAVSLIPEERRPRVVITGGREPDPLRPLVEAAGLAPWIDLRDWVSDEEVADLLGRATALVVPVLRDGYCLPAVEAMIAGVPLVLSDIGLLHEIAEDAAVYFDPRSADDLAKTLERVGGDPTLARDLARRSRRRSEHFSWRTTAEETFASIERAWSEDPRRLR